MPKTVLYLIAQVAFWPSVLSHCLVTNAYGNADTTIKGYGIGLLENTNRGLDDGNNGQRDCTVFSKPTMALNGANSLRPLCTKCPAGYDTECVSCKGVANCQKCPLYDINCPKCRQRNLDGCGRTYYMGSAAYYDVDSPYLRGENAAYPTWDTGSLNLGGWIDWMDQYNKIPTATAGGWLWVTMFQQTTDGAGPYYCRLDQTGKATQWQNLTVPVNVPGIQGASPCNNQNWEWPLMLPKDMKCTGEYGKLKNICVARCQNDAPNGPFGGCIVFRQVDGNRVSNQKPPQFDPAPKCKGFQYKLPITDTQIRNLAGDDSIGPAAKKYIRDMLASA
ncbi:hypothetical protein TWF694_002697 [Orbilia ellipsospora]|uniref:Uncharacterized protein n=1 Tax=Orbilia ellipsospora TaxID=2528407 RepID=A0AAV9X416_9PEZI